MQCTDVQTAAEIALSTYTVNCKPNYCSKFADWQMNNRIKSSAVAASIGTTVFVKTSILSEDGNSREN
jgi:hypothetical protein